MLGQDAGGALANVVAPSTDAEGGLFSETNDTSVGILLTHGAARVLLAGDAETKSEEYMAGRCTARLRSSVLISTKPPKAGFRVLLTEDGIPRRWS